MSQPKDMDDLMDEFKFTIGDEENNSLKPGDEIQIKMGTEEEEALKKAEEETKVEEEEALKKKTEEEAVLAKAAEDSKKALPPEKITPSGKTDSYYKKMALKYIEKGKWDTELAVDDGEGNPILVSDLETIDEDVFFQIEAAIEEEAVTKRATNFVSVEGMEDRRKKIIDLVSVGGNLTEVFRSAKEVEEFINPYGNVDLEDEGIQEEIYLRALVEHNNLDRENAQLIVDKAKKELTLDTKVKSYVEDYTKKYDQFVEGKLQQVKEDNKQKIVSEKAFKKALQEEYKVLKIDDKLSRRLASSATNVVDGEFEIDNIYAKKMEDSSEAAELILFLTDKEAYLEMKATTVKLKEQKKTRGLIKLISSSKKKPKESTENQNEDDEFKFTVK